MKRITERDLKQVVDRINVIKGQNISAYTKTAKGLKANVGTYLLSSAYGGWSLQRLDNKSGGVETIIHGYVPKRELYDKMQAFIKGLESAK